MSVLWVADWTSAGPWTDGTWLEIVMVVLGFLALALSTWQVRVAFRTVRAVAMSGVNGMSRQVAWAAYLRAWLTVLMAAALTAMSLTRLWTPQGVSSGAVFGREVSFVTTVVLCGALMGKVWVDFVTRRVIEGHLEETA